MWKGKERQLLFEVIKTPQIKCKWKSEYWLRCTTCIHILTFLNQNVLKRKWCFPFSPSKNYFYIYVNSCSQRCFRVCLISYFSRVWLFGTAWTVASQALCFHGMSQTRILEWVAMPVGCHALLQRIFPTHGSNPCLLNFLHWQASSLPLAPLGKH